LRRAENCGALKGVEISVAGFQVDPRLRLDQTITGLWAEDKYTKRVIKKLMDDLIYPL